MTGKAELLTLLEHHLCPIQVWLVGQPDLDCGATSSDKTNSSFGFGRGGGCGGTLSLTRTQTSTRGPHLSTVRQTRFHVDETRGPQRKSLEFQMPHSRSPSQPLVCVKRASFTVSDVSNRNSEHTKSTELCRTQRTGYQSHSMPGTSDTAHRVPVTQHAGYQ